MERFAHGGDIYRNRVRLDFSVNINPCGMPAAVRRALAAHMDVCQVYPDDSCRRLREALAAAYGLEPWMILCGNGATELIFALARALGVRRAVVPYPSFSEYERALLSVGACVEGWMLREDRGFCLDEDILECLSEEVDLLLLCNPGNPVGNRINQRVLEKILSHCMERGIFVMVDECFLEFLPDYEKYTVSGRLRGNENILVLRAFTKLYAMAGLRLGYCMTGNRKLIADMKRQLPGWNVSSPAQLAGLEALKQTRYVEDSRVLIRENRKQLAAGLEKLGCFVLDGEANFVCFRSEIPLYEKLLDRGILIRSCANYPGMGEQYYRAAVKKKDENILLLRVMGEICRGGSERWRET